MKDKDLIQTNSEADLADRIREYALAEASKPGFDESDVEAQAREALSLADGRLGPLSEAGNSLVEPWNEKAAPARLIVTRALFLWREAQPEEFQFPHLGERGAPTGGEEG